MKTNCDYCGNKATHHLSYTGFVSGNGRLDGRNQYPRVIVTACDEHATCVNYLEHCAIQSKLFNEAMVKGGVDATV
jgi:hypothetical protein